MTRITAFPPAQIAKYFLLETVRWGVHIGALVGVFLVGVSWPAVVAFLVSWVVGSTGTTLCYHRYFAHRSFKTTRWFQFVLALWGATALQRGPIWWAAVHREHHAKADTDGDWHSPRHGFWHAHMGWLDSPRILECDAARVPDLTGYAELRWLDTWYHLPSLVLIAILGWLGAYLQAHYPQLGTSAWQMIVWGFLIKATVVWQLTFAVNSVGHKWGEKRFDTGDDSRNGPWWFGLLTLGDGYHNNHHRHPSSARQGFLPRQPDLTYRLIKCLEALGLVWDLKPVPQAVLDEGRGVQNNAERAQS
jgi:stearoyl-CoA desaturase (delta-9 desaturase)